MHSVYLTLHSPALKPAHVSRTTHTTPCHALHSCVALHQQVKQQGGDPRQHGCLTQLLPVSPPLLNVHQWPEWADQECKQIPALQGCHQHLRNHLLLPCNTGNCVAAGEPLAAPVQLQSTGPPPPALRGLANLPAFAGGGPIYGIWQGGRHAASRARSPPAPARPPPAPRCRGSRTARAAAAARAPAAPRPSCARPARPARTRRSPRRARR
jgi:hypothetical protein